MECAAHVAVHLLAAGRRTLARTFATRGIDRFAAPATWHTGPHGVPLLDRTLVRPACRVIRRIPAGDHAIVLATPLTGATRIAGNRTGSRYDYPRGDRHVTRVSADATVVVGNPGGSAAPARRPAPPRRRHPRRGNADVRHPRGHRARSGLDPRPPPRRRRLRVRCAAAATALLRRHHDRAVPGGRGRHRPAVRLHAHARPDRLRRRTAGRRGRR
ncbi:flavin reductase [Catenuloplanes atrovinosus]|uniref:flavin reductase n=1 Tax=Catenuloplanes atrovinosus TaxID=137266 RepID=UPI0035B539F9